MRSAEPVQPQSLNSREFHEACIAIRMQCVDEAEQMVQSAGVDAECDAAWLNLRGVICERRGDWRRAKRFYGRAMRAERRFAAAEQNMRRWFELFTFGYTAWPTALGDEPLVNPLDGVPCKI